MSTKASIILTDDDEHWYIETSEYDSDESNNIYIEINKENICYQDNELNDGDVVIGIRGDCQLARIIKGLRDEQA